MTNTAQDVTTQPDPATDTRPLTEVCFENFALHPLLLQGVEGAGFIRCTPIQALTLPVAIKGGDVAGQAQTGTGKTAAFLVATFNRLLTQPAMAERRDEDPRAIILAPTRELAIQIEKDAQLIGGNTGLRFALIYGGVDYDKQREMLKRGVDVIIATPGRLLDYFKQKVVSFRAVEVLVLDEADRMFDLGFIKDIRYLIRRLPPREQRQCLMFSATLSHRVLELAYEHMNEPQKLVVESENVTADRVRQTVYFPATEEKAPLLISLLSRMDCRRSMVFVNTKIGCEKVSRKLTSAGFKVAVLSGDVPQRKREVLLGRFLRGEIELLVATDVAARGLHIPDVGHVFNYDLPNDAEDYVHRIGRTARLGAEGDAISFACETYAIGLPDIEKYIEQKIPVMPITPELLIAPERAHVALPPETGEYPEETLPPRPKQGQPRSRSAGNAQRSGQARSGQSSSSKAGTQKSASAQARGSRKHPTQAEGGNRDGAGRDGARPNRQPAAANNPNQQASSNPHTSENPNRKPRRRRGPRRNTNAAPAAAASAAPKASLLGAVKKGLKALFNRLPMPGRKR